MQAVQGETQPTSDDLMQAVLRLKPEDLDRFVSGLLTLRAQRLAPALSEAQAELLIRINEGLPADLARTYQALIVKRRSGSLTAAEHDELLLLTEQAEACQARRVADLIELARLRGTTLDQLVQDLGIRPPIDA